MSGEPLLVFVTVPSREVADSLTERLLADRLAACVQRLPGGRSTYRWKGAIESADEDLLVVKSTRARWDRLEEVIRSLHPYETPEIVAIPAAAASEGWRAWLLAETDGA